MGDVVHAAEDSAGQDTVAPQELPIESSQVEKYAAQRPDEPPEAVRREAKLVARYTAWLDDRGEATCRHRIPIPGGAYLFTDVFNKASQELIEAKASAARVYVRAGLGQLLVYARFLEHYSKALLLPTQPSADLIELLNAHGCGVIWEESGHFQRHDP